MTNAIATATWLDYMPTLPLKRGVPVIWENGNYRSVIISALGNDVRGVVRGRVADIDAVKARVDLGDPQGFAYALRTLASHPSASDGALYALCNDLCMRHVFGMEITDEDRVALAIGCTAVW